MKSKKTKVFKVNIWKTTYADALFSLYIRKRDGKCMRCGSQDKPLDNSHYWARGCKGTRFDPKNCIALCRDCHTIWEKQQNHEYKDWMIRWLGKKEYELLESRARRSMKMVDAVLGCMDLLKK